MDKNREHWGSRLGFVLAAAGSAIGLGTMWMFPYVVGQNGGGAFIVLFLGFTALIGVPLFMAELILGRASQRGVVGAFEALSKKGSSWPTIGWLAILTTLIIAGWYSVVAGWGLNYILLSITDAFQSKSPVQVGHAFEQIKASGDLNLFWQAIFLFIAWIIVSRGVRKGIENVNRILVSILLVIILGLLAYSITLDGFMQAVDYVLVPHFELLTKHNVLKALGLSLFTLSLGQGIMVTYGSYIDKGEDLPKTALIVGASIIGIAILVALMIFPMVFTYGFKPEGGEGLVYKILPYVFEQLPGSMLISLLFFTLLVFAALTSIIGQLEVLVANFMDIKGWSREKTALMACFAVFVIGMPTALSYSDHAVFPTWNIIFNKSFLETNYVLSDWLLSIFALFTAIFVGWVAPRAKVSDGFLLGSKLKKLYVPWLFCVRFLVPAAILVVMLTRAGLF